jgi:hypothetical protein
MIDYTISYRQSVLPNDYHLSQPKFDFFLAAYTLDDRTSAVFHDIQADQKRWLILPEYSFAGSEVPSGAYWGNDGCDEAEFINTLLDSLSIGPGARICIDITGVIAPYVLFALRAILDRGVRQLELIYAEPKSYLRSEETKFSGEDVRIVRQVLGFEGSHTADTSNDVLILGAGYDHELLKVVAAAKEGARSIQFLGLPALQPDMYQQNVLRASRAAEALGRSAGAHHDNLLVPAHDPFMTATYLSLIAEREKYTNLYLCPLSTKPQAAGFALFYLVECLGKPVSILYPFCGSFPKRTSTGTARVWTYTIDFEIK